MTTLGRGGRSTDDRARRAAEQAARAEEAAKAARLAEEAAAKAREAARLAQIAADEAAAALEPDVEELGPEEPDAEKSDAEGPDADGVRADEPGAEGAEAEGSVKASLTDRDGANAPVPPTEAEDSAADDSEPEPGTTADADDAETDTEPEEAVPAKKPARPKKAAVARDAAPSSPVIAVLAVLAVLVVVLGVAATMLFLKERDQNAVADAREDAAWAASRVAKELSAYDYRTIDGDMRSAAALTTGELREDYEKETPAFRAEAVRNQLVGTTTVMKTGVVSATSDKVVVLVFADRVSATKNDKTQRLPEPLRLKVTMVKVDGRWLASKMDVIS
ncbi:hypothetical protein D0T12_05860 [Actinomadura spongiicola]|uniref:Mce-associated membrane protein n=1 Tax=Actinomadura spongiicola TaxID=2303421 RepID=A0A372GL80_9ACTN|nr:hypothetical protein [Actinomadura spongiicola]RFS86146.1 hypothetical protein D0T12_05860 [Actinomadura spongiicola]